jgi:monolysocardiolipin acyltransferase
MLAVLSTATISAVGLICKAFLNSGLCTVQVKGLQTLKAALENPKQNADQGVITGTSRHNFGDFDVFS